MTGNGSLLKKSGWRVLRLIAALSVAGLIGPQAIASSTTGPDQVSGAVTAAKLPVLASATGSSEPLGRGSNSETSAFTADLQTASGFELTSRTFANSPGVQAGIGLRMLVWLAALLASVPMFVVIVEILAAMGFRKRRAATMPTKEFPRTVVLIPAHNEEEVIGRCLDSLSVDLPPDSRLLCVAHNCTDATAQVARQMGAEVIEVQDSGKGGKPDALKAGLRWLDANPPEVVVIVDADCTVSAGAVRILATRARDLNRPVMGAYFFAPADANRGSSTLSSLAVLLKNYVRPLGLRALGLPCLLNGSGSAYPFHALRNAPHGKGAIAEDYQLAIDLLRQGYPTTFVPEAQVVGELPKREDTALRQRRRWEHGHLFLAFRTGPRLLREGLKRLDKNRIALALEVSVPPLAFLGLMWVIAASLALGLYMLYGHGAPLGMLTGTAATFAAAVLTSWMRFAGVRLTLASLASVPAYLMWKLPLYREFFTRRETRWMKTARDSSYRVQHGLRAPLSR